MIIQQSVLGIVLRRNNIGERDRLVTFLTRSMGKVTVRAAGVRDIRSKRKSHLELFNTIKAQLVGRDDHPCVGQTVLVRDRSSLKSDLKLLRIAFHLVELTDRLLAPYQQSSAAFDLLNRALSSITLEKWNHEDRITKAYESRLLSLLGFGVPPGDLDNIHEYIEELTDRRLRSREILSS